MLRRRLLTETDKVKQIIKLVTETNFLCEKCSNILLLRIWEKHALVNQIYPTQILKMFSTERKHKMNLKTSKACYKAEQFFFIQLLYLT